MNKALRFPFLFLLSLLISNVFAQNPTYKLPEMVYVKGGSFEMGSNTGTEDERPQHEVILDNFSIGKYEVTRAEFRQFQNETGFVTQAEKTETEYHKKGDMVRGKPSIIPDGNGGDPVKIYPDSLFPIAGISWYGAQAYCEWLSTKTGQQYRLPTAAEWEFAARGGTSTKNYTYSGSNNPDEVAWYIPNSRNQSHTVGQKRPNELGLYDMSGNTEEWCSDWYNQYYYNESPKSNPKGSDIGKRKVLRGGSWSSAKSTLKVTFRNNDLPDACLSDYGFRVVREEKPTVVEIVKEVEVSRMKKEIDSKGVVDLEGILFKSGSALLLPASEPKIEEVARYLNEDHAACILIEGHTDNTGKKATNLTLSEKRANAVMLALKAHGISPERIQKQGFGDRIPVADNSTKEGQSKNRRVSMRKIQCLK